MYILTYIFTMDKIDVIIFHQGSVGEREGSFVHAHETPVVCRPGLW